MAEIFPNPVVLWQWLGVKNYSQVLSCLYDLPGLTQLRGRLLSEGRGMMIQMPAAKKFKTWSWCFKNWKGWGAIAKLLPLVDSFLLSTNEKALFFTVLNKLSVAYFMDKNYVKNIYINGNEDTIDAFPIYQYYFRGPWCDQAKWYMRSIRGRKIFQD